MGWEAIDWTTLPIATAALLVTYLIVRVVKNTNDRLLNHTQETTDKVLNFFGNHMSENVKQQAMTTEALRDLADAVRDLRSAVKNEDQASV